MLRKILMSTVVLFGAMGAASAADLPNTKAPPAFVPPPPPLFTWTGVYVGGDVGYQWGTSSSWDPVNDSVSYNANGVIGGAHLGYNYQMGQFVAGLEGDAEGSSYNGSAAFGGYTYSTRENVEGSVRGRIGYAWDRALFYGTGGVAFGSFTNDYSLGGLTDSLSTTRVGWTVGGGVEYAIDNNWSVRAEYRYTDFGYFNEYSPSPLAATVNKHEYDNRAEVGFSYKFDMFAPPGPVVAKY